MAPAKQTSEQQKLEKAERSNIIRDLKDGVIRAAVVQCCYSVEEFLLGLCQFPEIRLKNLKLLEEEIGYGSDKMKLFSKHILSAYFSSNPQLFNEIYGFPLSELHPDGLLSVRPWHDETIAVMAPHRSLKMWVNAILRESLAQEHKTKLSWQGNCLMLSSSLQSDIHRDLGGVTRYALTAALQDKLVARMGDEVAEKWRQAGIDLSLQFGWLTGSPKPAVSPPGPNAPLQQQLLFMLTGWKMQRCMLPHKHAFEKCPGYHVVQYKPNSNTPIFDARRPPLADGKLLYHAVHCKGGPDQNSREGSVSHYYTCTAGAACDKAHSLVELFYHPEHFKRQQCAALSAGKCVNCEAGLPEYQCAFWHTAIEQETVQQVIKGIAPQLESAASGLPDEAVSSSWASRASTPGSSRTASDAALSRAASAAGPQPGSSSNIAEVATVPRAPPKLTDEEEFPGLLTVKTGKKTSKTTTTTAANSSRTTTDHQHELQPAAATAASIRRLAGTASAVHFLSRTAVTSSVMTQQSLISSPPVAPAAATQPAAAQSAALDSSLDAWLPQSYDEVSHDTIRFLFQGPGNSSSVDLHWYYIDPDGCIQGGFSPEDMIAWCVNELLPIQLLVYPHQLEETPPTSTHQFWPLNQLLSYAEQALCNTLVEQVMPSEAGQPATASRLLDRQATAADQHENGALVAAGMSLPPAIVASEDTATTAAAAATLSLIPQHHPTAATAPNTSSTHKAAAPSIKPSKSVEDTTTTTTTTTTTAAAAVCGTGGSSSSSNKVKSSPGSHNPLQSSSASGYSADGATSGPSSSNSITVAAEAASNKVKSTAALLPSPVVAQTLLTKRMKLNINAAPFMPTGRSASSSAAVTPTATTPVADDGGADEQKAAAAPSSSRLAMEDMWESTTATAAVHESDTSQMSSPTAAEAAAQAVTHRISVCEPGVSSQPATSQPGLTNTTCQEPAEAAPAAGIRNSDSRPSAQFAGTGVCLPPLHDTSNTPHTNATGTGGLQAAAPSKVASDVESDNASSLPQQESAEASSSATTSSHTLQQNQQRCPHTPSRHTLQSTAQQPEGATQQQTSAAAAAGSSEQMQPAADNHPAVPGYVSQASSRTADVNSGAAAADGWQVVKLTWPKRVIQPSTAVHQQQSDLFQDIPDYDDLQDSPSSTEPEAVDQSGHPAAHTYQQQSADREAAAPVAAVPDSETSLDAAEAGVEQDAAETTETPPAAVVTTGSTATSQQHQQQPPPSTVRVRLTMYDMSGSSPDKPVLSTYHSLSSSSSGSAVAHLALNSPLAAAVCGSNWHSVLLMAVKHRSEWPHPQLMVLQQQQQLGALLDSSSSSTELQQQQSELEIEAYCSCDIIARPSSSGVAETAVPLLHQYVMLGRDFKDNLWQAVRGTQPAALDKDQQQKAMMQHLCKVFAAAASQGLLWRHDQAWVVFNSGLPRVIDSGSTQLIFLRRNSWPAGGFNTTASSSSSSSSSLPRKPWVAHKKMVGPDEAAVWLKGVHNIPPPPVCETWVSNITAQCDSRSSLPLLPAQHRQQQQSGMANAEAVWRPGIAASGGSSSKQLNDATPSFVPQSQAGPQTATTGLLPADPQEQQQRQQASPAWWPLSQQLQQSSSTITVSGNTLLFNNTTGSYDSAAAGSHTSSNGGGSGPPSAGPSSACHAVLSGVSSFPGAPLLTPPVLPHLPTPVHYAQEPAAAARTAAKAINQQQHQGTQYYRDLSAGGSGLQLVLQCSAAEQQQSAAAVGGSAPSWCRLLVSQSTAAEKVVEALWQWLSEQTHLGQQQQHSNSSSAPCLLVSYQQSNYEKGVKSWQLLQYEGLMRQQQFNTSSSNHHGPSSSGSAKILHPLGAQLMFSTSLTTLDMTVQSIFDGASVADLLAAVTGEGHSQLLTDVSSVAAAEYWGAGKQILQHYLADNFIRAAVQGRLFVHSGSSTSSGVGGAVYRSGLNKSSSNDMFLQTLPGTVGLLAMRPQHNQRQQQDEVGGQHPSLLLFNTGLLTPAGQQVMVLLEGQGCADDSDRLSSWQYHSTRSSFQCSGLQPLPAPAASPALSFNPSLPLHLDLDAMLQALAEDEHLQQQLHCEGQPLPAATWDSLLQGAVTSSLVQAQQTPGIVLQMMDGDRLLQVVPLFMIRGEPVRLVMLLEQVVAAGTAGAASGYCKLFYSGCSIMSFAKVYQAIRAVGQVTWLSWAQYALENMQQQFAEEGPEQCRI